MSVHEQNGSYRRGVVLGLTLAEVFILLVFCLLLLIAFSWKSTSAPSPQADKRQKTVEKIVRFMDKERGEKSLDEHWREVRRQIEMARIVESKKPVEERAWDKVRADMNVAREKKPIDEYWRDVKLVAQNAQGRKELRESLETRTKALNKATTELIKANTALNEARAETIRLKTELQSAQSEGHKWPPIIRLTETDGFKFPSGDASLSGEFRAKLRGEIVQKILAHAKRYKVDVIEVVGHTDEQPLTPWGSNLDKELLPYLHNRRNPGLRASDNAGLGLARAAAVVRYLRSVPELKAYRAHIVPLSGAQVLDVSGKLADGTNKGDVPDRRRIEIRLRRSNRSE